MYMPIPAEEGAELDAWHTFEDLYRAKHPEPLPPGRIAAIRDWLFWAIVIASLASVLLAALRTGDAFRRAALAAGAPVWTANAEMLLAIVAFEATIVIYKAMAEMHKQAFDFGVGNLWLRIGLLSSISMVAGFEQSLFVIANLPPTLLSGVQYALAVGMGLGGTLAAVIAGDTLGKRLAYLNSLRGEAWQEYQEAQEKYQRAMRAAFTRSLKRHDIRRKPVSRNESGGVQELVLGYLQEKNLDPSDGQVSPAVIARELDLKPTSVRSALSRIRNVTGVTENGR